MDEVIQQTLKEKRRNLFDIYNSPKPKVFSPTKEKLAPQDPNLIKIPKKKSLFDCLNSLKGLDFIYENSPPTYILKSTDIIVKGDEYWDGKDWVKSFLDGTTGLTHQPYRRSIYKRFKKPSRVCGFYYGC